MKGSAMQAGMIGYGCGGFVDWSNGYDADSVDRADHVVRAAIDAGITLFDIADIYAYGGCEEVLGQLIARDPALRDRIVLQSKCGIKLSSPLGGPPDAAPHHTSYASIVADVESSLRRLNTDRLDILLLHRPSPLARKDEIAISIAWFRKHPADILRIIGSMKPENIRSLAAPTPVLSTAEWWRLFYAASQFAPVRAL